MSHRTQLNGLRNISLVYMPPSNYEAMVHYEETIRTRVAPERIHRHISLDLRNDPASVTPNLVSDPKVPVESEDVDAALSNGTLSDHLRMQWTLLGLGLKCGSRVWVPASDQKRIREHYEFNDFERNFAAGLDTQTRYVENIDVVYKEEFRIDAAFEIENSTSIYSGLLHFADLSLVAPNTVYPLFIVAPQEKRNRLYEQLRRPIFQKLRMHEKVRYLSYEAVDDIDRFAQGMERGLNVDLIAGKAESIRLEGPP